MMMNSLTFEDWFTALSLREQVLFRKFGDTKIPEQVDDRIKMILEDCLNQIESV